MDPYKHMETSHAFGGGMYIKQCEMPPGIKFEQHRHKFDHLSILASGEALLEVDGIETHIVGPQMLTIAAGKTHSVTPLTPIVWYCCHATEHTDEHEIDHELIA